MTGVAGRTNIPDEAFWATWRSQFPGVVERAYLDGASHGPQSLAVRNSMADYLDSWKLEAPWETDWQEVLDSTVAQTAALLGAGPTELAVVPSVTDALQGVQSALAAGAGKNRVLIGEQEWISSHHTILADARLKPIVVPAGHAADEGEFAQHISADTLLVVRSHVCYRTGRLTDLKRLARACRDAGAYLFVDAYQSAGTVRVDLNDTGVDFAATGYLKHLLGSPGAACLFARQDLAEQLRPGLTGWRGQLEPMESRLGYASGATRFTRGTWPVPSLYAAVAGTGLILEAGLNHIAARIRELTTRFHAECTALGLKVLTPANPNQRGPIVSISVPKATEVAESLRVGGVLCSERKGTLRFSFHAYNNDSDVSRAIAALKGHLPSQLQEES